MVINPTNPTILSTTLPLEVILLFKDAVLIFVEIRLYHMEFYYNYEIKYEMK